MCYIILASGFEEAAKPIFDPPAGPFLVPQLGGNVPICDPFAALAHDESRPKIFLVYRRVDDRVLRYRSAALGTFDLVFHSLLLTRIKRNKVGANPGNICLLYKARGG